MWKVGGIVDIKTIEGIVGSQFVWAILFVILAVAVLSYLKNENAKREEMLENAQKEQKVEAEKRFNELKEESRDREDKLMANQEKFVESLGQISKSVEGLNQAFNGLQNDHSSLAREVSHLRNQIKN